MHRLLAIEDDSKIAKLIHRIATEVGFDARIAGNSQEIHDLCTGFSPDVILLDIYMPDMDGFEVLEFLNARGCTAHIVILSGTHSYRPMIEKMAKAKGLSIIANLSKPFRIPTLRLALQEIKGALPELETKLSEEVGNY